MTDTKTQTRAQQAAASLRILAEMIETCTDIAEDISYPFNYLNVPVSGNDDPKGTLASFIRAGKSHGAKVAKEYSEKYSGVDLIWPGVCLHVYAERDQVCERVVTGTETVTRTVPDPAALAEVPEIEVTETVETVEWVCKPLLAADEQVSR
jgi:hypothetical protein